MFVISSVSSPGFCLLIADVADLNLTDTCLIKRCDVTRNAAAGLDSASPSDFLHVRVLGLGVYGKELSTSVGTWGKTWGWMHVIRFRSVVKYSLAIHVYVSCLPEGSHDIVPTLDIGHALFQNLHTYYMHTYESIQKCHRW